MYPDDDTSAADDGFVELPPPPDNPNAGFWHRGALHLVLVCALALYMLVTRSPEPEPALDELIVSSIEAATPAKTISTPDIATTEIPIPRMRDAVGVPAPGWVIESKATPMETEARDFVVHAARDMNGGDYDSLRNVSHEACAARCKSDARCRAYTYNRWESACFVKSSLSPLKIEPRGVTGVLAGETAVEDKRPPVILRTRSKAFPGVPYRQVLAPAYQGCAKACLDDAACLGFNFSEASRSCALMASLDKPVPGPATDLGIKQQGSASTVRHRSRHPLPPPEIVVFEVVMRELLRH